MLHTIATEETITAVDPDPDPLWQHTDSNGHYHAHSANPRHRYPTLRMYDEWRTPCGGTCSGVCNGEGYLVTRWHCQICDEEIVPGVLSGPRIVTRPGRTRWHVEVYPVPGDPVLPEWLTADDLLSVRVDQPDRIRFGVARLDKITVESGACSAVLVGVEELGELPVAS